MIIILMNKSLKLYFFVVFISMGYVRNIYGRDGIPGRFNFKGKYTSGIKNSEIVVPQRVNKDGSFMSHLVSHRHSKRSTNELENIFYKIPIEGKDYLIELTPNRKLISTRAVVEVHKNIKNLTRSSSSETSKNETFENSLKNFNIKKLENTECYFSGQVKGEGLSKAALSTCYGLAGFIQINKGFYTIEPVAEHDPFVEGVYPHILYKSDSFENSSVCQTIGEITKSLTEQVLRKRRDSNLGLSLPMYIETLIVMDKTLIDHHQDSDCENYVLTVFNMAFNLFHDASLGLMITLTIVRIIRLEIENDEMNLRVNADAEKTLQYFQTWQYEINPGDDSHPNHHDIAILITRVNVCYSPSSCGLLGLTTIGKACDPKLSAALCEDTGLRLGFVIAHEIGHLLGADHDPVNLTCDGKVEDEAKTVMHPQVSLSAQTWSENSQAYFKTFFQSGMGSCFLDEPEEHHFNDQDLLPGVMYNADFQCKHLLSMNARECDIGSTCDSLNCYIPGYACIVTHTPPADGTRCGENMWCHDKKCLIVGERPGAIDGNWGEWSAWSDCSRTCGSGVAYSTRQCDKPLPFRGGKNCIGERKKYKICAATPCETGRPSFRDIQCGEFDDWIYPEDGKSHSWKAHYLHDDNPCTLYCINEEKQVAALRSRVVDGTMCYRGIRDICIGGTCKNVPCNLHFDSNAVEDACGVCHGDGTGCEFSEGIETLPKLHKGITKLVNVPSGTRNIKVEEMSPTLAKIIVRDKDTKVIYVRGKTLGMFSVPGSQAWLGMIRKNQEALNIPGPVTKPLSIWIQRLENVTVKWSMALPAEQQRKPEFTWDFLKWGPCSAKCGPGTQKSEPSCMEEKAGLVEDTFCADLEIPATKVRPCEVAKCEPRWMVGDWKDCDSSKKQRKRVVYCIKQMGEGEGESEIIADSHCSQPKPHEIEACENRRKREDSEFNTDHFSKRSMFKSDGDELGFHKKYDDYLTHFTPVSVPQRKSETIPLHLVLSPHFKHYFRVLETPEEEESDSILTNSTGFGNDPVQDKVSSDFYKNTFSGHQVDVSHIHPKTSLTNTDSMLFGLEGKIKKNLWVKRSGQNQRKMSFKHNRKFLKRQPNQKYKKQSKNYFLKIPKRSNPRSLFANRKKGFNYVSRNLTYLVDKLSEGDDFMRSIYLKLIEKGKIQGLNSYERNRWRWNTSNQKKPIFGNIKKSISNFLSPKEATKDKLKLHSQEEDTQEASLKAKSNKEFDGSGIRKIAAESIASINLKSYNNMKLVHEKNSPSNPFNPILPRVNYDKQKCKNKRTATLFKNYCNNIRDKNVVRSDKMGIQFRNRKFSFTNKMKRSSYRWKKPKLKDSGIKSNKETFGSGMETRNYLNNLFRDSRPKNTKPRPKLYFKKPVINLGQLVIDKDTIDNKVIEIVFLEDDDYVTERTKRLPKPHRDVKRLTLRGRQAFDVLRQLRNERQSYYRSNDVSENENSDKTEINIKIPNLDKSMKTTKNSESSSTESSSSSSSSSSSGGSSSTQTTQAVTKSTVTTTTRTTKATTTTTFTTTTKKPETATQIVVSIPKTDSPQQSTSTTNSETKSTTKQGVTESVDNEDCFEYDVDENIPDSDTTAQSKDKKKEKKKKTKGKAKLEKVEDFT